MSLQESHLISERQLTETKPFPESAVNCLLTTRPACGAFISVSLINY